MPRPKIYVKACINGARTPDQHPNLPVTPEQLAAEALAAHRAGAKAVHMHPKTADGVDSLDSAVVDAAVAAVRHAAPGLPLGVTTGLLGAARRRRTVARRREVERAARLRLSELARTRRRTCRSSCSAGDSASRSASSTPRLRSRGRPPTSRRTACG